MNRHRIPIAVLALVGAAGCNSRELFGASANALGGEAAPAAPMEQAVDAEKKESGGMMRAGSPRPALKSVFKTKPKDAPPRPQKAPPATGMLAVMGAASDEPIGGEGAASVADGPAAATRAWFPETFLFQPLVVTDAQGQAEVAVRVPDRLTNWRVLALAHSRDGAQAGAVTSFRGTLPAYVDPVVPKVLLAGDEVRLPIQVVNTTEKDVVETLSAEASGARLAFAPAKVTVPAGGNVVQYGTLAVERPGQVAFKATLGATDAVVRAVTVQPTGRQVEVRRGGTLAAPREVKLEGPADLDPQSAQVRLTVFPGALALLRSELTAASSRDGVAESSYALMLGGTATRLLQALGGEPDADAIRDLSILATQRVIRLSLNPGVEDAAMLAQAALAQPDNPVLARLSERLAENLARAQRPDGTFSGGNGWTLQRLLVTTADCVRALDAGSGVGARGRQRAAGAKVRASGAFERNVEMVRDGYTAAAILASGAVSGTLAEKLRERVRAAVVETAAGARALSVEPGVVRADATVPSQAEATALAILALEGDPKATWRADLGATLLGAYSPSWGWGDGRTNLVALRAVLAVFKDPVPKRVKIGLAMDGKPLKEGDFDAAQLKDVLSLEAEAAGAAGAHTWTVSADPAVPGLGFALTLTAYVPWTREEPKGLELAIESPKDLAVGKGAEVALEASAPSGVELRVRHALPAGVQPDRPSLEALVAGGAILRFRVEDGAVTLDVPPRTPGQIFQAKYRVVATLGGKLHAAASSIALADKPETAWYVPPSLWEVR